MKKIFISFFCLLCLSGYSFGQTPEMYCDYETVSRNFRAFGGASYEATVNPDVSGINISANVGHVITGIQTWDGLYTERADGFMDFTSITTFSVKVWSDTAGVVLLKLENACDDKPSTELSADYTDAGNWQELTFDFTGTPNDIYNRIVFYFDYGETDEGENWFFDDISGPGIIPPQTTKLCARILGNTTWSDTVKVLGDLTVWDGFILTIDPGTYVEFQGHFNLNIWGTLLAEGTPGDTIIFTVKDTTGYHDLADTAGGWAGIRFDNSIEMYGAQNLMYDNDTSKITCCKIEYVKNTGSSYMEKGAGAILVSNYSRLVISKSVFRYNQNNWGGGAITIMKNSGISVINNLLIYNNAPCGGAIFSDVSSPIISSNIFNFNKSFNIDYNLGGGAINCNGSLPTIMNNEIKYNEASQGGGILCINSKPLISGNIIAYNKTWEDAWGGGGLLVIYGSAPIIIDNIVSNNYSNEGGCMKILASSPEVFNNVIVNNTAHSGGAFQIVGVGSKIINNTIYNNHAADIGGGFTLIEAQPTLYNNIIWGNTSGNGPQFYISDSFSKAEIRYCVVEGGKANFGGSAFMGIYENIIEINPKINDPSTCSGYGTDGLDCIWDLLLNSPCINAGTNDPGNSELPDKDLAGRDRVLHHTVDIGAYEAHIPCITVKDTIKSDTTWIADTVKVDTNIIVLDEVTLTITPGTRVEFQDYYGLSIMGTLLAVGTKNDPILFTVSDTSGFTNKNTYNGGWMGIFFKNGVDGANALMDDNDTSRIDYCIIEYTKCRQDDPYPINNGAVFFEYFSKAIISNSILQHNYAVYGAGISCYLSGPVIRNNEFRYNAVQNSGGAIYCGDVKIVISDNFIHNNHSDYAGGGIVANGEALIKNNILQRNSAFLGGGIRCSGSNLVIIENVINNNIAGYGGGLYSESGKPFIINNQITNNLGDWGEGGICFQDIDQTLLLNNSIVNNHSNNRTGGISLANSNPELVNNIIWGNTGNTNNQIFVFEGTSSAVFRNCLLQDGQNGFLVLTGTQFNRELINIIDTFPEFVNPSTTSGPVPDSILTDYSLLPTSPCINAGIYTGYEDDLPATDLKGNQRIFWDQVDIGAFEEQTGLPVFTKHPSGNIKCRGESLSMSIQTKKHTNIQWTKDGKVLSGLILSGWQIDSLKQPDQGLYMAVASNAYGSVESNTALVIVETPPEILVEPDNTWNIPGQRAELRVDVRGSEPMYYQWYKNGVALSGGIYPEYIIKSADYDDEGVYYCIMNNACGADTTTPVNLYLTPQICMVTVSTISGNNLVIWEKYTSAPLTAYNIYRETTAAGIYDLIGTVPYSNLSILEDTTADPTKRAYIYKITGVDTSGYETELDLCNPHKTIHLLVSTNPELKSTQLAWDKYYGFDYQTYNIYRSPTGTNFTVVDAMPSTLNSWTDPEPITGDLFYRVAVEKPIPCVPTGNGKKADAGPYSHSMSNMDDNRLQAGENPPDTITLSNDMINENNGYGMLIGRFNTTDLDSLDTHTYSLVTGEGDNDNISFTILGDMLLAAEIFDYELKDVYLIRVRCTDKNNLTREEVFTIYVNDVVETGLAKYLSTSQIQVYPNPFDKSTILMFNNPESYPYTLVIMDLSGKVCRIVNNINTSRYELEREGLKEGFYFIELRGPKVLRGKIIVE